ncbi:MAG: hypothetical protein HY079_11005 [Elusimicrobia bacterium]|nr:hypothetical protein [Elusimicrobiota bacterium]
MRKILAVVSVTGLLGAAGFVVWSAASRPDDTYITGERADSFNLKEAPVAARPAAAPRSEELRDAVSSPVSPRPIALAEMAPAAAAAPAKPVRPFLTAKLEKAVRSGRTFAALLRAPARMLGAGSALASPRALRAFLADKAAVNRYMDSTLVRVVLNSPTAAKAVIGSSLVVRAFLASPAMKDKKTVAALLSSRMVGKMLDCPGVQAALTDEAVIRRLATDPKTAEFLATNPQALAAIAGAAPELARALAR